MSMVQIEFDERFKAPLKKGTKVATIRTERKGDVGDTLRPSARPTNSPTYSSAT